PVARTVADAETMLAECAGLPLWSLQDKDIDDLVPRAHALLGRVMGTLVLPLVREADRRDLAAVFDAANTAGWVRDVLRVPLGEARGRLSAGGGGGGAAAGAGRALAGGGNTPERAGVPAGGGGAGRGGAGDGVPAAAEQELLGLAEQYDPRILAKMGRRILGV